MNIELKLIDPTWIEDKSDDPEDQCAHGKVRFQIDGIEFLDETKEFTVSAASLFLLRSLFSNHSEDESVTGGNYLFPCCGFSVYEINTLSKSRNALSLLHEIRTIKPLEKEVASGYPVVILGCPSGTDIGITHFDNKVIITSNDMKKSISKEAWFKVVVGFASQVFNFYDDCTEKVISNDADERKGWQLFWQEFDQLKKLAEMTDS